MHVLWKVCTVLLGTVEATGNGCGQTKVLERETGRKGEDREENRTVKHVLE